MLKKNEFQLIISHLSKLNFTDLSRFFSKKHLNKIVNFMLTDKKNFSKSINIITLNKIGRANTKKQFKSFKIKKFISSELLK